MPQLVILTVLCISSGAACFRHPHLTTYLRPRASAFAKAPTYAKASVGKTADKSAGKPLTKGRYVYGPCP